MYAGSHWQDRQDRMLSPDDLEDHGDAVSAEPMNVPNDVPTVYVELSKTHIYARSASQSGKAVTVDHITDKVRFPPQAHSRSPSARQRFATWSTSDVAEATTIGADIDALESGYAGDLTQFHQRQHSTGLSLLEKVWRW